MTDPRRTRSKSYFTAILAFFLMISFSIIVLSSVLFFTNTQEIIDGAFSERNQITVDQISHMFDVLHAQLIPGLKEASYNNYTISRLMYCDSITDRDLLDGLEFLDDLLLAYPLLNSLYIYNGQTNFFISTTEGVAPVDGFYDKAVLSLLQNYDSRQIERYWPRQAAIWNNYEMEALPTPVLTLLLGTTPGDNTPLKGAFIANIDVRELERLLESEYGKGADEILIVNHLGEEIGRSVLGSEVDIADLYVQIAASDPFRGILRTQGDQLVAYRLNERLGWYIIKLLPLNQIRRAIHEVIGKIILIMFGLLLFGALLSFLASRFLYRPVDALMNLMSGKGEDAAVKSGLPGNDELDCIARSYRSILNEKATLADSLYHLRDDYRLEVFHDLLKGRQHFTLKEELPDDDLVLLDGSLCLFLLQMDDQQSMAGESGGDMIRRLYRETADWIQRRWSEAVFVDTKPTEWALLLPGEPELHLEAISELREFLVKSAGKMMTVAWIHRSCHEGISLADMYAKARSAAGGKFVLGLGQVIPYEGQDRSTMIFPGHVADKLIQDLRLGKVTGAQDTLRNLVDKLRSGTYQDFRQHIRILCYRIQLFLVDNDLPEIFAHLQSIRSRPESLATLNEFQEFFTEVLESIHRHLGQHGNRSRQHLTSIEEYLQEHFRDPVCCVQSIAADLDLSPNYLREIYKSLTGISLSDKLVELRVQELCRLLTETSGAVKDLYHCAGFTNYNSFFTSFKRSVGLTPVEYRRKHRKP